VQGVDYAWGHPRPQVLAQQGYRFACRYLSRDASKNLTAGEAAALHAAGVATVSNWEAVPGAPRNGYSQGVRDAQEAASQHLACGGPGNRPIYFSVDFPATADELGGPVTEYFRGVASVLGVARTGAYGGVATISYLFDRGLIRWGWQTYAWSAGRWDGRAQLRQVRNGVSIDGADCDVDESTAGDFGQWGVDDMAALDDIAAKLGWVDPRVEAMAELRQPSTGAEKGHDLPFVVALKEIRDGVKQLLAAPPGALTDAQVQVIADRLVASGANGLTAADHAGVVEDVKAALRMGTD
jgi:hypothetical protein